MSVNKPTLGQAIDTILGVLEPLEAGARKTALAAVCMELNIASSDIRGVVNHPPEEAKAGDVRGPTEAASPSSTRAEAKSRPPGKQIDIRTLKDQKKPSSARQMACIVGFYLQELAPEGERKETINTQDLEKYFKQAGFKLPGKISQVLSDARAAGYFDVQTRGEYKLNAVGYNLVAHSLPSGGE